MPWTATSRYGLVPAPGALGLVQDLLNTAPAAHEPDLLAEVASARAWVSDAAAEWSAAPRRPGAEVALDVGDLQELRAFRDDLREVTTRAGLRELTGRADLREVTGRADGAAPGAGPAAQVHHAGAAVLELGSDGSVRRRALRGPARRHQLPPQDLPQPTLPGRLLRPLA